jgi:hypothetical protein
MLNRCAPTIARQKNRDGGSGEFLGMRPSAILGAAWVIAAAVSLFAAAPAAAQETSEAADAAPPAEAVDPPADIPLTPEESTLLGNALLFDSANLGDSKPAKPLRLPGLNDPNKFDVSHSGKPDGSSMMVVKQPLATEWDAKVGAALNHAATSPDGYRPAKPLPAVGADQDSGAAWASVGVPNLASVDARVEPNSDQGKLGTTFKHSMPLGGSFSLTLQNSYTLTENFSPPAARPSDLPLMAAPAATTTTLPTPQIWGNQKAVKFDVLATGTTFGAGVATASNDPVTHNTFSAEQKVYGPLHVTTSVTDFGHSTTSKSITAGLKLNW